MPQAKRNLKVKRPSKVVSVAGIAGAFLASSTSRSVANVLPQSMAPFQVLNLGEEEISDVTLATFHFVDGESPETPLPRVQLARGGCGGGCGGCGGRGGGCGGFRGCGGCAHGGCADTVIVDGKILMRGGKVLTLNEHDLYEEAQDRATSLIRRTGLEQAVASIWPMH